MTERLEACRSCKSTRLWKYLDLGEQPLANSYHRAQEQLPTFPLQVLLCEECYLSQLSIVVDPALMFSTYLYVSGTTTTFRNHCKDLADDAISRLPQRRLRVLDIAANDGTLLMEFRLRGCEVVGVDPAENLRTIAEGKGIRSIVGYWNSESASASGGEFDIITATNVFGHVHDLDGFLRTSRIALKEDGMLILEFPYCERMVRNCEFDTIYHEHLSYFLLSPLRQLIWRHGFQVSDIRSTSIHGGSLRLYLECGSDRNVVASVDKLAHNEAARGLLSREPYAVFARQARDNAMELKQQVDELRSAGRRIIGYGASAKGNTMLNYAGLSLEYIVDDNPLKWGWRTPGRNIPIEPVRRLAEESADLEIVLLAWNFEKEVAARILCQRPYRDDHLLLYVPNVRRVPVSRSC